MIIDLLPDVIFHQPRHDDDHPAHEKHKDAHHQCEGQHQSAKEQKLLTNGVSQHFLPGKAIEDWIQSHVCDHLVQGIADHPRLKYGEVVCQGHKTDPRQQTPTVSPE